MLDSAETYVVKVCKLISFRYSLAFKNIGTVQGNDSFVQGCSFDFNFNIGIGVFGTNNLLIEDNVIYHTVGPTLDVEGNGNQLLNNLLVHSVAEGTFRVSISKVVLL